MWRPHDQPIILAAAVKAISKEEDDDDLSTSGSSRREQESNNSRDKEEFRISANYAKLGNTYKSWRSVTQSVAIVLWKVSVLM